MRDLLRGSTWSIFKALDAMDRDDRTELLAKIVAERARITPSRSQPNPYGRREKRGRRFDEAGGLFDVRTVPQSAKTSSVASGMRFTISSAYPGLRSLSFAPAITSVRNADLLVRRPIGLTELRALGDRRIVQPRCRGRFPGPRQQAQLDAPLHVRVVGRPLRIVEHRVHQPAHRRFRAVVVEQGAPELVVRRKASAAREHDAANRQQRRIGRGRPA